VSAALTTQTTRVPTRPRRQPVRARASPLAPRRLCAERQLTTLTGSDRRVGGSAQAGEAGTNQDDESAHPLQRPLVASGERRRSPPPLCSAEERRRHELRSWCSFLAPDC
jgi:hypothetical protein